MTIQHFTNGEIHIDGKQVGWAETYMQARTKSPAKFAKIDNPHEAFVFWPVTANRIRGDYIVVHSRLYDTSGKINEATISRIAL